MASSGPRATELLVVGLIPAKLTSRRLPRKNLALLGGVPLVAHAIRTSRLARDITETFVSTEAEEVAAVARTEGARVISREAALSEPAVTNLAVMRQALPAMVEALGRAPDLIVLLQPTHPFRDPQEIDRGIGAMRSRPDATSLVTVGRVTAPLGQVVEGWWQNPQALERRAGAPPHGVSANVGSFYIFRTALTVAQDIFFGGRVLAFELARPEQDVDIDEPWDLEMARAILERHPELVAGRQPVGMDASRGS